MSSESAGSGSEGEPSDPAEGSENDAASLGSSEPEIVPAGDNGNLDVGGNEGEDGEPDSDGGGGLGDEVVGIEDSSDEDEVGGVGGIGVGVGVGESLKSEDENERERDGDDGSGRNGGFIGDGDGGDFGDGNELGVGLGGADIGDDDVVHNEERSDVAPDRGDEREMSPVPEIAPTGSPNAVDVSSYDEKEQEEDEIEIIGVDDSDDDNVQAPDAFPQLEMGQGVKDEAGDEKVIDIVQDGNDNDNVEEDSVRQQTDPSTVDKPVTSGVGDAVGAVQPGKTAREQDGTPTEDNETEREKDEEPVEGGHLNAEDNLTNTQEGAPKSAGENEKLDFRASSPADSFLREDSDRKSTLTTPTLHEDDDTDTKHADGKDISSKPVTATPLVSESKDPPPEEKDVAHKEDHDDSEESRKTPKSVLDVVQQVIDVRRDEKARNVPQQTSVINASQDDRKESPVNEIVDVDAENEPDLATSKQNQETKTIADTPKSPDKEGEDTVVASKADSGTEQATTDDRPMPDNDAVMEDSTALEAQSASIFAPLAKEEGSIEPVPLSDETGSPPVLKNTIFGGGTDREEPVKPSFSFGASISASKAKDNKEKPALPAAANDKDEQTRVEPQKGAQMEIDAGKETPSAPLSSLPSVFEAPPPSTAKPALEFGFGAPTPDSIQKEAKEVAKESEQKATGTTGLPTSGSEVAEDQKSAANSEKKNTTPFGFGSTPFTFGNEGVKTSGTNAGVSGISIFGSQPLKPQSSDEGKKDSSKPQNTSFFSFGGPTPTFGPNQTSSAGGEHAKEQSGSTTVPLPSIFSSGKKEATAAGSKDVQMNEPEQPKPSILGGVPTKFGAKASEEEPKQSLFSLNPQATPFFPSLKPSQPSNDAHQPQTTNNTHLIFGQTPPSSGVETNVFKKPVTFGGKILSHPPVNEKSTPAESAESKPGAAKSSLLSSKPVEMKSPAVSLAASEETSEVPKGPTEKEEAEAPKTTAPITDDVEPSPKPAAESDKIEVVKGEKVDAKRSEKASQGVNAIHFQEGVTLLLAIIGGGEGGKTVLKPYDDTFNVAVFEDHLTLDANGASGIFVSLSLNKADLRIGKLADNRSSKNRGIVLTQLGESARQKTSMQDPGRIVVRMDKAEDTSGLLKALRRAQEKFSEKARLQRERSDTSRSTDILATPTASPKEKKVKTPRKQTPKKGKYVNEKQARLKEQRAKLLAKMALLKKKTKAGPSIAGPSKAGPSKAAPSLKSSLSSAKKRGADELQGKKEEINASKKQKMASTGVQGAPKDGSAVQTSAVEGPSAKTPGSSLVTKKQDHDTVMKDGSEEANVKAPASTTTPKAVTLSSKENDSKQGEGTAKERDAERMEICEGEKVSGGKTTDSISADVLARIKNLESELSKTSAAVSEGKVALKRADEQAKEVAALKDAEISAIKETIASLKESQSQNIRQIQETLKTAVSSIVGELSKKMKTDEPKKLEMTCRPWSREDFFERLRTFRPSTWYGFCAVGQIDPVECARHGWYNSGRNALTSTDGATIEYDVDSKRVRELILVKGHVAMSPWVGSPCPEEFRSLGPMALDKSTLRQRADALRLYLSQDEVERCSGQMSQLFGGDGALAMAGCFWNVEKDVVVGAQLQCDWCAAKRRLRGSGNIEGFDVVRSHFVWCPIVVEDAWKVHRDAMVGGDAAMEVDHDAGENIVTDVMNSSDVAEITPS